mmetsp:Transcript_79128/g.92514  ORF Transcript_79128/g.92514 Transcript_79128/m.92514 type:complete len:212 (+) Transcript_79128:1649-2284(+)
MRKTRRRRRITPSMTSTTTKSSRMKILPWWARHRQQQQHQEQKEQCQQRRRPQPLRRQQHHSSHPSHQQNRQSASQEDLQRINTPRPTMNLQFHCLLALAGIGRLGACSLRRLTRRRVRRRKETVRPPLPFVELTQSPLQVVHALRSTTQMHRPLTPNRRRRHGRSTTMTMTMTRSNRHHGGAQVRRRPLGDVRLHRHGVLLSQGVPRMFH